MTLRILFAEQIASAAMDGDINEDQENTVTFGGGAMWCLDNITPRIAIDFAEFIRYEDLGDPDMENWELFLKQYKPKL